MNNRRKHQLGFPLWLLHQHRHQLFCLFVNVTHQILLCQTSGPGFGLRCHSLWRLLGLRWSKRLVLLKQTVLRHLVEAVRHVWNFGNIGNSHHLLQNRNDSLPQIITFAEHFSQKIYPLFLKVFLLDTQKTNLPIQLLNLLPQRFNRIL